MIQLSNISLRLGDSVLLDEANATVFPSWRVCLIGRNGSGKSSLFKSIMGEIGLDGGEIGIPKDWRVAHMAQEVEALEQSALDYVLDGDDELRSIERALDEAYAQANPDGDKIARLQESLDSRDGYAARSKAQKLLAGLGVEEARQSNKVSEFSGGWRIRLNLARTLYQPSDLLLLDEPTNHLDMETVEWLQDWLKHYPGTLLLISHDRDFIDAVSDHILHVHQQSLKMYTGNYSSFERQRAEHMAQQQAMAEKQAAMRAHMQAYVDRFKAKASKAKQAQSRIKAMERLPQIALAHIDSPFTFEIQSWEKASSPLVSLTQADLGYGESVQIGSVGVSLQPGQRIGLLGVNGAGKSTLVKSLIGELELMSGERTCGEHLRIGYFAQHQLESLRLDEDSFTQLARSKPDFLPQQVRDYLGSFGFKGDDVFKIVGSFSGGEKARLALAMIAVQNPNVLVMDEPTNHLDLEMREALVAALEGFEGAIVIVSHDKHLLSACVDEFWLIDAGKVAPFNGDLDDYSKWLRERNKALNDKTEKVTKSVEQKPKTHVSTAPKKMNPIKLKLRIEELENIMESAETRLEEIDAWLNTSEAFDSANHQKMHDWLEEKTTLEVKKADAEDEWLELQD